MVALSGAEDDGLVALIGEPFPWAISAGANLGWEHSMRLPHNRAHTLGYQMRLYGHPVPAAKAVEAVNTAMETTRAGRRGRPVPPGSTTRRRRLSRAEVAIPAD